MIPHQKGLNLRRGNFGECLAAVADGIAALESYESHKVNEEDDGAEKKPGCNTNVFHEN